MKEVLRVNLLNHRLVVLRMCLTDDKETYKQLKIQHTPAWITGVSWSHRNHSLKKRSTVMHANETSGCWTNERSGTSMDTRPQEILSASQNKELRAWTEHINSTESELSERSWSTQAKWPQHHNRSPQNGTDATKKTRTLSGAFCVRTRVHSTIAVITAIAQHRAKLLHYIILKVLDPIDQSNTWPALC